MANVPSSIKKAVTQWLRSLGGVGTLETDGSVVIIRKDNLAAGLSPTGSDNFSAGYKLGSLWIYNNVVYICTGDGAWLNVTAVIAHTHPTTDIVSGILPIVRGGTGGNTAASARTALSAQTLNTYLSQISSLTLVNGDILTVSGGAVTRLPIGASNDALTVVAGAPAWQTPTPGAYESFASLGLSTTTSAAWQNKLSVTTSTLGVGTYLLLWSMALGNQASNRESAARVLVNGVETAIQNVGYRLGNTEVYSTGLITITVVTPSTRGLAVEYRAVDGTATIKDTRLALWRVT